MNLNDTSLKIDKISYDPQQSLITVIDLLPNSSYTITRKNVNESSKTNQSGVLEYTSFSDAIDDNENIIISNSTESINFKVSDLKSPTPTPTPPTPIQYKLKFIDKDFWNNNGKNYTRYNILKISGKKLEKKDTVKLFLKNQNGNFTEINFGKKSKLIDTLKSKYGVELNNEIKNNSTIKANINGIDTNEVVIKYHIVNDIKISQDKKILNITFNIDDINTVKEITIGKINGKQEFYSLCEQNECSNFLNVKNHSFDLYTNQYKNGDKIKIRVNFDNGDDLYSNELILNGITILPDDIIQSITRNINIVKNDMLNSNNENLIKIQEYRNKINNINEFEKNNQRLQQLQNEINFEYSKLNSDTQKLFTQKLQYDEIISKVKQASGDKEYSNKNIFFNDVITKVSKNFRTTRKISQKDEKYNAEDYQKYPKELDNKRFGTEPSVSNKEILRHLEELYRKSDKSGISPSFLYAYINFRNIPGVKDRFENVINLRAESDTYYKNVNIMGILQKYTDIQSFNKRKSVQDINEKSSLLGIRTNVMNEIERLKNIRANTEDLEAQINDLRKDILNLDGEVLNLTIDIDNRDELIGKIKSLSVKFMTRINFLSEELNKCNTEVQKLKDSNSRELQNNNELQKQLNISTLKIQSLEADIKSLEAQIQNLEANNSTLQNEINSLKDEINKVVNLYNNTNSENQKEKLLDIYNELVNKLKRYMEDVNTLTNDNNILKNKNTDLEIQILSLQNEISKFTEIIDNLRTDNNITNNTIRKLNNQIETYKLEIQSLQDSNIPSNNESQQILSELRTQISNLEQRINELTSKNTELNIEIQGLNIEIKELQNEKNQIGDDITSIETEINSKRFKKLSNNEQRKLIGLYNSMIDAYESKEAEIQRLGNKIQKLQNQNIDKDTRILELENSINILKLDNKFLEKSYKNLENKNISKTKIIEDTLKIFNNNVLFDDVDLMSLNENRIKDIIFNEIKKKNIEINNLNNELKTLKSTTPKPVIQPIPKSNIPEWMNLSDKDKQPSNINLINRSSSCYCATVVQMLYSIPEFRKYILTLNITNNNSPIYYLKGAFEGIQKGTPEGSEEAQRNITCSDKTNCIMGKFTSAKNYKTNYSSFGDASELLLYIFENIDEAIINTIFGGIMESTINCKKNSPFNINTGSKIDDIITFDFDVNNYNISDNFKTSSDVDSSNCDDNQATKIDLYKIKENSKYMIIRLKRDILGSGTDFDSRKIEIPKDLTIFNDKDKSVNFTLYGAGLKSLGHWIYVQTDTYGNFTEYDDLRPAPIKNLPKTSNFGGSGMTLANNSVILVYKRN